MLVLSAPSGTGKTTLTKMLKNSDSHIHTSISVTTRPKRPGELDGREYYFTDHDNFVQMIKSGEFIEYAEVFGYMYGTPRAFVEKSLSRGEDVLFDIDWQGHRQLISTARSDTTSVFILPPSKLDLMQRLKARKGSTKNEVEDRIMHADPELSHWHEYDYIIINRDIEESLGKLLSILKTERLRKERRVGLPEFIEKLLHEKLPTND